MLRVLPCTLSSPYSRGLIFLTTFQKYGGMGSALIYAKEDAEAKKLNDAQREKRSDSGEKKQKDFYEEEKVEVDLSAKKVFTWENLNYHVPVPGGTKRLLHDVMGYVKPGTLTALMGASGAGKLLLFACGMIESKWLLIIYR